MPDPGPAADLAPRPLPPRAGEPGAGPAPATPAHRVHHHPADQGPLSIADAPWREAPAAHADGGGTLAALAWLDQLAQALGSEGARRLLAYYEGIGWITAGEHAHLLALAAGLQPRPPPEQAPSFLEVHATSYASLERLRGARRDPPPEGAAWPGQRAPAAAAQPAAAASPAAQPGAQLPGANGRDGRGR